MVKYISLHTPKHPPGQSVYERYLHTEELLSLQTPEDELVEHDELQFQVVHELFELWWKEAAFELRSLRNLLQQFNLPPALRLMHRVIRIQFLMLENMRMLETMTPWDFHGFRKVLADGACTNSPSFHALMTNSPCSGMISLTCLLTNRSRLLKSISTPSPILYWSKQQAVAARPDTSDEGFISGI